MCERTVANVEQHTWLLWYKSKKYNFHDCQVRYKEEDYKCFSDRHNDHLCPSPAFTGVQHFQYYTCLEVRFSMVVDHVWVHAAPVQIRYLFKIFI